MAASHRCGVSRACVLLLFIYAVQILSALHPTPGVGAEIRPDLRGIVGCRALSERPDSPLGLHIPMGIRDGIVLPDVTKIPGALHREYTGRLVEGPCGVRTSDGRRNQR